MRVYRENRMFSAVMVRGMESATCYVEVTVTTDFPSGDVVFPAWLVCEVGRAFVERYEGQPEKSAAVIAREVFELAAEAVARTDDSIVVDMVSAGGIENRIEYRADPTKE